MNSALSDFLAIPGWLWAVALFLALAVIGVLLFKYQSPDNERHRPHRDRSRSHRHRSRGHRRSSRDDFEKY